MKVEELGEVREGLEIENFLPNIKAETLRMQNALVNGVAMQINKGELTPEIAQQKWIEYVSYMRLVQRFEQKVRMGHSVGEAHAVDLSL